MPTIINTNESSVPIPQGGPLEPFEAGEVSRHWLRHHGSHRLKTPSEYNQMVRRMERGHLIDHIKLRRSCTDEDLTAQGSDEELVEQLLFEETDLETDGEAV